MAKYKQVSGLPLLPMRPTDGHKGTFGTVVVIAGSETMLGAAAFCAGAAFRSGTGLVKVANKLDVVQKVLMIEPSATGVVFEGAVEEKLSVLDEIDGKAKAVLAVGPGLGSGEDVQRMIRCLLDGKRTVVLDADGLNALAEMTKVTGEGREGDVELILTPHPGEYTRLAESVGIKASGVDAKQRVDAACELARAHRAVVVLKGSKTVVSDGQQYFVNKTGNVCLATAGSGDVLTGTIAAMVAQGVSLFEASVLGVYLHGRAADTWADRHGCAGLKANDLLDLLPTVMQLTRRAR